MCSLPLKTALFSLPLLLVLAVEAWGATAGALTVLPVLREGRPSEALTQGATERLLRLGEEPLPPRVALSGAEQGCETSSCLGPLAQRLRAGRLLGGAVVGSGARRFMVQMFFYDRGAGRVLSESGFCDDCSERQLTDLVASLAAKLVDSGTRPAAAPVRPSEALPASSVERRLGELAEAVKVQGTAVGKAREAAEAAARSGDVNGRSLEKLRGAQDKLRDRQDKLLDGVDRARDAADKARGAADKLRAEAERARDSSEKAKEGAERTRELAERARQSAEGARQSTQVIQTSVERLRERVDKAQDAVERARAAAEAARAQAEKLGGVVERAAAAADAAQADAAQAREASAQAGLVAGKTLQSIDQLSGIAGDLRGALTNVEPLRAAAEQTQQTAQGNAQRSSELLRLAEAQRAAAGETLLQAEQALRLSKEQDARRGLSRRRKHAAWALGSAAVLLLGAAIALVALDGMHVGPCQYDYERWERCALNLSPGYSGIGFTLSALLGASTVAVLAVPSPEHARPAGGR